MHINETPPYACLKKKTVFQKTKVTSVGKDVEKGREPLWLLVERNWHTHMVWKQYDVSSKN